MELEHTFACPYCGDTVSVLLDLSNDGDHNYVEDCETCCNPIELFFSVRNGTMITFDADVVT
ncbi:MAG: motif-containing cysteine-rich protein [Candidatus Peribacteria bacterium]|nr:motif-containing cysteine-rich protein [Candidatus Peribacteria bacterium]